MQVLKLKKVFEEQSTTFRHPYLQQVSKVEQTLELDEVVHPHQ
jgi:hypothetical protein